MKLRIELSKGQLGSTNWLLVVTFRDGTTKSFVLGQDVKFIRRTLGYEEDSFFDEIGMTNKRNPRLLKWNDRISQRVANFIKQELKLTPVVLKKLECWDLSAEW